MKESLSSELVKDLFTTYVETTACATHDMLGCTRCDIRRPAAVSQEAEVVEDDLRTWSHHPGTEGVDDAILNEAAKQCRSSTQASGGGVTFTMGCHIEFTADQIAKLEQDDKAEQQRRSEASAKPSPKPIGKPPAPSAMFPGKVPPPAVSTSFILTVPEDEQDYSDEKPLNAMVSKIASKDRTAKSAASKKKRIEEVTDEDMPITSLAAKSSAAKTSHSRQAEQHVQDENEPPLGARPVAQAIAVDALARQAVHPQVVPQQSLQQRSALQPWHQQQHQPLQIPRMSEHVGTPMCGVQVARQLQVSPSPAHHPVPKRNRAAEEARATLENQCQPDGQKRRRGQGLDLDAVVVQAAQRRHNHS